MSLQAGEDPDPPDHPSNMRTPPIGRRSRIPLIHSGGRIRTCDLRVMSPTSYLAAPPRNRAPRITGASEDCQHPEGESTGVPRGRQREPNPASMGVPQGSGRPAHAVRRGGSPGPGRGPAGLPASRATLSRPPTSHRRLRHAPSGASSARSSTDRPCCAGEGTLSGPRRSYRRGGTRTGRQRLSGAPGGPWGVGGRIRGA